MLALIGEEVGGGFGYVFHLFFVAPSDIESPDLAREHIFSLCIVAAPLFSFLYAAALFVFRGKPPIPPTYFPYL